MRSSLHFHFSRFFRVLVLLALLLSGLPPARPVHAATTYTVTTLADNTNDDSDCTLREAIMAAQGASGYNGDCGSADPLLPTPSNDTIQFNPSLSGTIYLDSGHSGMGTLPNIQNAATVGSLTIDGGGSITISGGGSVRVMYVNSGANLTLQNLTIANGKVTGAGSSGGGIYNWGTLTVTNSTFSGNSADWGGGIYNDGGTLTVTNSTFSGNSTSSDGGGIFNDHGTLTMTGVTFSNNSAYFGGGISNDGGTLTVTNSTFSDNSATSDSGGGIYNDGGTLTVTNSTFSSNRAPLGNGGGIRIFSGTATLKNTIIANSSGGDCVGTASGNNNLIKDSTNACGLSTAPPYNNIIGVDPKLASTPVGSPAYFPLLPGSPAIDAGDNATCAAAPVSNQSQNGVTRPVDSDGNGTATCDIGAYETPGYHLIFLPLILK